MNTFRQDVLLVPKLRYAYLSQIAFHFMKTIRKNMLRWERIADLHQST